MQWLRESQGPPRPVALCPLGPWDPAVLPHVGQERAPTTGISLATLRSCPWGLADRAPSRGTPMWHLKADSLFLVKAEAQSRLKARPGEPAWEGAWNVLEVEGLCGWQAGGGRAEQSSNYLLFLDRTTRAC